MFTGIVTDVGEVLTVKDNGNVRRIAIASSYPAGSLTIGASVACAGCCLTVVALDENAKGTIFEVDAAAETLAITHVGEWTHGTPVNLERSLRIGDELGGHLVSGHVDGLAAVIGRDDLGDIRKFGLRAPAPLSRFIAKKGSVTLDGVSLTVNEAEGDEFSVLIIPHTLKVTTLGHWRKGWAVNLEVDVMARYAARLIETR
jgi:riboflavin synthase